MKNEVFVIAEAGVNHNGNFEHAIKMINSAKAAGCDAVKFQTFTAENCVSRCADKAEYQKNTTGDAESQLEMIKKLELKQEEFVQLQQYCNQVGICFLSTPFDLDSIDFLEKLDLPLWKIPSGEITNLPYLIKIAKTGKPVILSTGMSTMQEIEFAFDLLKANGAGEISLLHCNTEYPTPYEDVNLHAMGSLKEKFKCKVGYSDHTEGIEVPIAAVAMGAEIIEKHFTLDCNLPGPDHKASLEPLALKQMVLGIRNVEQALGCREKKPTVSECKNINIARKSIVAGKDIRKGEIFTTENLAVKRPGNGISPIYWFDILGRAANRDYGEDQLIELEIEHQDGKV